MPVIMSINTNKSNKIVTVYKRSFNDKNINKFNQELEKIDISPIINENKANVSYKISIKKYLKIFDQAFPVTQFKQAQTKNKWFNEELKNLLQEKQKLFKKYCMIKSILATRPIIIKLETNIFMH